MRWLRSPRHPFPLLLYLEWILLGIALLSALPSPIPTRRPRFFSSAIDAPFSPLGMFCCIGLLGLLGLRLPVGKSPLAKVGYTALGFGLSWAVAFLGGWNGNSFPTLLLVVVIRACLLFPWSGRLPVAGVALSSFVLRLLLSIRRFYSLGAPGGRPLPRPMRSLSAEQIQGAVLNLSLNSALLFALVLVFVLLMVSALVAERQSRDRLFQANDRLRRYAILIENQSALQERARIAREIHDSVGHSLTAQSIQLENVAMRLSADVSRAAEHLQKARDLGKDALQNVRQSVASLRRHPLQGKSLTLALQDLIQEFEQNTGIAIDATLALSTTFPTEQTLSFYRMLQEILTNIAKHSQATVVKLTLNETPLDFVLTVTDNGSGFNPAENMTGFGLQSLRERAETLGGTFELTSAPGQGCHLQIQVPKPGGNA